MMMEGMDDQASSIQVALLLDFAHLAISSSYTPYSYQQVPFRPTASTSLDPTIAAQLRGFDAG
jgi:hypothetical protein